MKGRRQIKEGFSSLETIETWIVCVPFSGWMRKTKDWSAFEQGMVVGAWASSLCQELQCCWVFHAQQFPACIKNGPTPKGCPANLTQLWEALESTWASVPVNAFDILYSPCPEELRLFGGKKSVQLNIRKVFLMFSTLSVNSMVITVVFLLIVVYCIIWCSVFAVCSIL